MVAMEFLPTRSLPMYVLCKVVSTAYNLPQLEITRKSIPIIKCSQKSIPTVGVCSKTKPVGSINFVEIRHIAINIILLSKLTFSLTREQENLQLMAFNVIKPYG